MGATAGQTFDEQPADRHYIRVRYLPDPSRASSVPQKRGAPRLVRCADRKNTSMNGPPHFRETGDGLVGKRASGKGISAHKSKVGGSYFVDWLVALQPRRRHNNTETAFLFLQDIFPLRPLGIIPFLDLLLTPFLIFFSPYFSSAPSLSLSLSLYSLPTFQVSKSWLLLPIS